MNKTFVDENQYNKFIDFFINNLYDADKHMEAVNRCKKYYEPLAKEIMYLSIWAIVEEYRQPFQELVARV